MEQRLAAEISDLRTDPVEATSARAAAVVAVLGMAVGLAMVPFLVGFGLVPFAAGWLATALGGLVAVVGGVKLAAIGWALAARFVVGRTPLAAAASMD